MDYLYHRVPKNMDGAILYPLNKLENIFPEVYSEQIKKYEGREVLLTTEIQSLKCLWNDVLHFTAVTPGQLKSNLAKADIHYKPTSFFKIPVSMIEGGNSIAFTYRRDKNLILSFKEYEEFDAKKIEVYRYVPEETIKYYKDKKSEGVRPLLYHLVPHILYKGNIDTKGLEIITV